MEHFTRFEINGTVISFEGRSSREKETYFTIHDEITDPSARVDDIIRLTAREEETEFSLSKTQVSRLGFMELATEALIDTVTFRTSNRTMMQEAVTVFLNSDSDADLAKAVFTVKDTADRKGIVGAATSAPLPQKKTIKARNTIAKNLG